MKSFMLQTVSRYQFRSRYKLMHLRFIETRLFTNIITDQMIYIQ